MSCLIDVSPAKRIAALALEQGKSLLSPQTHFVHYCYEEKSSHTIPTYENFCFVLARLRSRMREEMEGAMTLLSSLFPFQSPSGNFPIYLHEFPAANSRNTALYLLVPLFWIKRQFAHLFPFQLKESLNQCISRLTTFCKTQEKTRPFPPSLQSIHEAFRGNLNSHYAPETAIDWTNFLLAAQMAGREEEVAPRAASLFNQHFHTFTGAPKNLFQRGGVCETTLYDLVMAQLTGSFPKRLLNPHISHLHAAVFLPFKKQYEGKQETALFQINKEGPNSPHCKKGFHSFRLLFGAHSLVCQDTTCHIEPSLTFTYPEQQKEREELSLYVNRSLDLFITIHGKQGTLFQMGDIVTIKSNTHTLNLQWDIVEGEGTLIGHISLGNRPAQLIKIGFQAFDWKITIRTIHRSADLKLKMSATLLPSN